jgi:hypothetical protein
MRRAAIKKLSRGIAWNFDLVEPFCEEIRKTKNAEDDFYLAVTWILGQVLSLRKKTSSETNDYFDLSDTSYEIVSELLSTKVYLLKRAVKSINEINIHIISMTQTSIILILQNQHFFRKFSKIIIHELRTSFLDSKSDPNLHNDLYNIILPCSNIAYPEFYQAWHNSSSTDTELPIHSGEVKQ